MTHDSYAPHPPWKVKVLTKKPCEIEYKIPKTSKNDTLMRHQLNPTLVAPEFLSGAKMSENLT